MARTRGATQSARHTSIDTCLEIWAEQDVVNPFNSEYVNGVPTFQSSSIPVAREAPFQKAIFVFKFIQADKFTYQTLKPRL